MSLGRRARGRRHQVHRGGERGRVPRDDVEQGHPAVLCSDTRRGIRVLGARRIGIGVDQRVLQQRLPGVRSTRLRRRAPAGRRASNRTGAEPAQTRSGRWRVRPSRKFHQHPDRKEVARHADALEHLDAGAGLGSGRPPVPRRAAPIRIQNSGRGEDRDARRRPAPAPAGDAGRECGPIFPSRCGEWYQVSRRASQRGRSIRGPIIASRAGSSVVESSTADRHHDQPADAHALAFRPAG